jgi:hypothetical protein
MAESAAENFADAAGLIRADLDDLRDLGVESDDGLLRSAPVLTGRALHDRASVR